jgi:hypothetical protein
MGANIWFWLIYVIVGIFGGFFVGPWRSQTPYGVFGGWAVIFILVGILGLSVYGTPIR